jgi:hypothetical protein
VRTAQEIKSQAVSAKRAATSITALVEIDRRQHVIDSSKSQLTKKELEQLEVAAQILRVFGARATAAGKSAAKKEAEEARAIEKALETASQIIAKWPKTTAVDQIAIIRSGGMYSEAEISRNLDLQENDLSLKDWLELAVHEITLNAAYHAVKRALIIEAVMADAAARLEEIKGRSSIQSLAEKWDQKMGRLDFDKVQIPSSHLGQTYNW